MGKGYLHLLVLSSVLLNMFLPTIKKDGGDESNELTMQCSARSIPKKLELENAFGEDESDYNRDCMDGERQTPRQFM